MHQSAIKVEIKMPIYLHILQKQFHIKTISSCSFAAWELSALYFTTVVEKTPTSAGTVHPTIRRNIQENCAVILPIREYLLCSCSGSIFSFKKTEAGSASWREGKGEGFVLLLGPSQTEAPSQGKIFQQQQHLTGKRALDSESYTDPFYFSSALIHHFVLSLLQKIYISIFSMKNGIFRY